MKKKIITCKIDGFHEKGAGLASYNDKPVLVWNALPGEEVVAEIVKKKGGLYEAISTEIIKSSPDRIEPRDSHFLSGSPWQILKESKENELKKQLVEQIFAEAEIELPDFELVHDGVFYNYRNKMEYGFWEDDGRIDVALFLRGQKRRQALHSSSLAADAINVATRELVAEINRQKLTRVDLKSVIIRSDSSGKTVCGIFVTNSDFEPFELLSETIKGLGFYYSDRRSPASRIDNKLREYGEMTLHEEIAGNWLAYGIESFFQVNIPVFHLALADIDKHLQSSLPICDFYCGVGTIGLAVNNLSEKLIMVESNAEAVSFAKWNAQENSTALNVQIYQLPAEQALEKIECESNLILDPPRSGLHNDVIKRILEVKPKQVIYLSCNPVTQARDLKQLLEIYQLKFFKGYNFFPRTPHAETLAVLSSRT